MWAAVTSAVAALQQPLQSSQSFATYQQQKQAEQPLALSIAVAEELPTPDAFAALLALLEKNRQESPGRTTFP
jgi:hypothetical protein